jgi:hypothetical protein
MEVVPLFLHAIAIAACLGWLWVAMVVIAEAYTSCTARRRRAKLKELLSQKDWTSNKDEMRGLLRDISVADLVADDPLTQKMLQALERNQLRDRLRPDGDGSSKRS